MTAQAFDDSKAAENLISAVEYVNDSDAYYVFTRELNRIGNLTIYAYFVHLVA